MPRPLPDVLPVAVVPATPIPGGVFGFLPEVLDVWGFGEVELQVLVSALGAGPPTVLQIGAQCRPIVGGATWADVPALVAVAGPPFGVFDQPAERRNLALPLVAPAQFSVTFPALGREMRFGALAVGGPLTLSIEALRRL